MYSNQANMARPAPFGRQAPTPRQVRSAGIKKYHACANASTKEQKKAMPRPCSQKAKKALVVQRAGGAQAIRQRRKRRRAAAGFGRRA